MCADRMKSITDQCCCSQRRVATKRASRQSSSEDEVELVCERREAQLTMVNVRFDAVASRVRCRREVVAATIEIKFLENASH